jgi:hypothetical protein
MYLLRDVRVGQQIGEGRKLSAAMSACDEVFDARFPGSIVSRSVHRLRKPKLAEAGQRGSPGRSLGRTHVAYDMSEMADPDTARRAFVHMPAERITRIGAGGQGMKQDVCVGWTLHRRAFRDVHGISERTGRPAVSP